jgi:hypothetical protein
MRNKSRLAAQSRPIAEPNQDDTPFRTNHDVLRQSGINLRRDTG